MRLALAFGRPDVDRFAGELTAGQLQEWLAFIAVEPLMPERLDIASAGQQAMQAEINRDRKRRFEPFSAEEFMPRWETPQERQERREQEQAKMDAAHATVADFEALRREKKGA